MRSFVFASVVWIAGSATVLGALKDEEIARTAKRSIRR